MSVCSWVLGRGPRAREGRLFFGAVYAKRHKQDLSQIHMYIASKHMCTHADKLEAHIPATLSHPCADFSISY